VDKFWVKLGRQAREDLGPYVFAPRRTYLTPLERCRSRYPKAAGFPKLSKHSPRPQGEKRHPPGRRVPRRAVSAEEYPRPARLSVSNRFEGRPSPPRVAPAPVAASQDTASEGPVIGGGCPPPSGFRSTWGCPCIEPASGPAAIPLGRRRPALPTLGRRHHRRKSALRRVHTPFVRLILVPKTRSLARTPSKGEDPPMPGRWGRPAMPTSLWPPDRSPIR
jgi:hypothetical protein